jgi:hypothetical protein
MKKKSFFKKTNPPSPPLCTCPMEEEKKNLNLRPFLLNSKKNQNK